jgi:hypothetical protein
MSPSFTAQYLTVRSTAQKLAKQPEQAGQEDIDLLHRVLSDPTHSRQTCAHFLYLEAASALSSFVSSSSSGQLRSRAWETLHAFATASAGSTTLAAAQALGSLPLSIKAPQQPFLDLEDGPPGDVHSLISRAGMSEPQITRAGRSLVCTDPALPDRILVLKMARTEAQGYDLANEAWWMQYLAADKALLPDQHIPVPLHSCIRMARGALEAISGNESVPEPPYCLPYLTTPAYFTYALDPDPGRNLDFTCFDRVLATAARGFGQLSRQGIVHTAPIPLFHNRAQSGRRDDQGRYVWTRGGRLDRWFASCLYPNFGLSGLRDFEHLRPCSGNSRHLFHHLGTQILSLILAVGSWFRLQDANCMGLTPDKEPMDARHLFDPQAFALLLKTIVREYSAGFLGSPLDTETLGCDETAKALIEPLGVDRHMTEVLRAQDQLKYTGQEFAALLRSQALDPETAMDCAPGEQDITLVTGPHLGEFNSRISAPELIGFTAAVAGQCIARAFFQELADREENCLEYSR